MPRLQQLSLVPAPVTLRLEALPSSFVNSLRLAEFSAPQKEGEESVDALVAVARNFWRPNLRTLLVEGCSLPSSRRNLFPPERYGTSSITSLTLSDCGETMRSRAASSCVTDIIRCIKRLQHFSIDYYTPWDAAGNWKNVMQPWHFAQLLGPDASTLETIEIGTTDAAQFPNSSLMGSLAGYCKLKRLLILETFLGQTKDESWTLPDVLPHSVEEFQLQYPEIHTQRGPDKDLKIRIKRMEDLAAAKLERFPGLRRVVWWYQPTEVWYLGRTPNYGPESDMDHLGAIFADVGVKFDWLTHYEFRETPLIKEQEKWWDLENKYAIEDE